jgi:phosphatidylglycerophosphatase A
VFWDAYTLWNYKAKVIYYSNSAASESGKGSFLEGPYRHYPLNLPMMKAWTAFFMGRWSESFVNLNSAILFTCLLTLVYTTLKKAAGKMPAMIFTYILASIPVLLYNVIGGYADMAAGYYFLAASVTLYYWHKTKRKRFLIFTGVLSSIAMFTKNEGIAIVFPALLLTFLFYLLYARLSWRHTLGYIVLFAASTVLILFWLQSSQALSMIARISGVNDNLFVFHDEAVGHFFGNLFNSGNYNLFWGGIILVLLLKWRSILKTEARFFLIPSLLSFGAIVYVFLFTENVKWLLNATTFNRTMLLVIPLLTLSAGFLFTRDEQ